MNCESCGKETEELHQRQPYDGQKESPWLCDDCFVCKFCIKPCGNTWCPEKKED